MGQGIKFLSYKEGKRRVKHVALTGFLRRKWNRDTRILQKIVHCTDVSPYLGALPPELRNRLPKEDVSRVTYEFRNGLENFLVQNIYDIRNKDGSRVYDLKQISDLFDTPCKLLVRGVNEHGINIWQGGVGFVCKLSFPEINAHYALKLYDDIHSWGDNCDHGIWFEVATALAASYAEPCDNNKIYMASLKHEKYMLSAWAGDVIDNIPSRENKNEIFATSENEDDSRNRRCGRRIDWGETYKTSYGSLSYLSRKLYRQIMSYDMAAVEKSIASARCNTRSLKEIEQAIDLISTYASWVDDKRLENFIANIRIR